MWVLVEATALPWALHPGLLGVQMPTLPHPTPPRHHSFFSLLFLTMLVLTLLTFTGLLRKHCFHQPNTENNLSACLSTGRGWNNYITSPGWNAVVMTLLYAASFRHWHQEPRGVRHTKQNSSTDAALPGNSEPAKGMFRWAQAEGHRATGCMSRRGQWRPTQRRDQQFQTEE